MDGEWLGTFCLSRYLAYTCLGSPQDGGNDRLIASAAAQIPGQGVTYLCLRGLWRFPQKRQGTHEHARRTEATLQTVFNPEGLLQRV